MYILFFVLLLIYIKKKRIDVTSKRILYTYLIYWSIAICGADFQILGIYKPSTFSMVLQIISILSFVVGFLSVKIVPSASISWEETTLNLSFEKLIKNKIFVALAIFSFVYISYMFSKYFAQIAIYSMAEVRDDFFEGELLGPRYGVINMYFLQNFVYVLCVILGYFMAYKRNILIFPLLIIIFLYSSLGGGRFGFIRCFSISLFVAFFLNTQFFVKNKFLKVFSIFAILLSIFFLLVFVTSARVSGEISFSFESIKMGIEKTFEHILKYTSGAVVAFDYAIKDDYIGKIGGLKLGSLTFSGLESLLQTLFSKIGIAWHDGLTPFANIKQDNIISIGDSSTWNALYTWNLWFWCDFGILGIVFFPYLIAKIYRKIIGRLYNEQSLSMLILACIMFMIVLLSVPDLQVISRVGTFLFMIILYINKNKSIYLTK